jgi:GMP synthase-like glutamine amidotransferase
VRILALVHGPTVRAELFGDVARAEGHELVEWEVSAHGPPPEGFDAVMVFGGRMNVGEEGQHPWLNDEYELLRGWVDGGTPLLGVCLGAQMLAHAAGGSVGRAPQRNAGFYEVALTDAGRHDPVLGVLPDQFTALLANAYQFEPPTGAERLACTDSQEQAYRIGERAWGLQFHPEVRRHQALAWWSDGRELPRSLPDLTTELDAELPAWSNLGRELCLAFLAAARQELETG